VAEGTEATPASGRPPASPAAAREGTVEVQSAAPQRDDALTQKVVESLSEHFDARIELRDHHGSGRVEIHYDSYEALQAILERLEIELELTD